FVSRGPAVFTVRAHRLRRRMAPAVRLLDSHPATPLGASPPGPPVASPMCKRRGAASGIAPRRAAALTLVVALALAACGPAREPQLFERLPPERSGVTFVNRLPDDTAFSILDYMYYYDGGGVAVGDVNNDGLPDLYFTSNLGSNRLYLNKGNYRFEDITERAGVADTGGWKTGVTMADVNGDGWVDIYVSAVDFPTLHGHN